MERIEFTPELVERVAARAERITGGLFALGACGSHPEHGVRYFDAHGQQVWYGAAGARQACAYYTGGAMRYLYAMQIHPEGDDGEFLLAVQVAYSRYGATARERIDYHEWEMRGADRAQRIADRN